jgi:hypothetical protein
VYWIEYLEIPRRIKEYNYLVLCLKEDIKIIKEHRCLAIAEGDLRAKVANNKLLKQQAKQLKYLLKRIAKLKHTL